MWARQIFSFGAGALVTLALMVGAGIVRAQTAPIITQQPLSQLCGAGTNVTLTVAVSGAGPFNYQWQFNGANLSNGVVTLVAGKALTKGASGDGGPATNATLNSPREVSVDSLGNLYIADAVDCRIRKVNAAGIITTVAGVTNGLSGDGGPATNADLSDPEDVAVDSVGNIYIADTLNSRIRRVGTNGIITTYAGTTNPLSPPPGHEGDPGNVGDGGPATNALLYEPSGVAVDLFGNVFIADTQNYRIRVVGTNGVINTVAGKGIRGFAGDGGPATNAYLDLPFGVAVDATGDLLIADTGNNRIRMVGTNGIINTLAGSGGVGFGGDGYSGDGGQATNATLSLPESVTVDIAGNWFITDTTNNRIRQVATNGIISTVISGGTGLYRTNFLDEPSGVCIDTYGNLFMACPDVPEIFKTRIGEPSLLITNLSAKNAGNYSVIVTSAYGSVTSMVATVALEYSPSISIQPAAYQMAAVGDATTFSVTASGTSPLSYQWQFDGANLAGVTNSVLPLTDLSTNEAGNYDVIVTNNYGSVTSTVAELFVGSLPSISQEPSNQTVFLGGTTTLAVGASGTGPLEYQWQFDGADLAGPVIVTVAGNDSGDAATNMLISHPFGLAVDASGNLFIADQYFNRICKIATNGVLTTVAGAINSEESLVFSYFSGDGGPATNATMFYPSAVAVDASGDVFIADSGNGRVREVNSDGIINTFAGGGTNAPKNGIATTNLELGSVDGVAVDSSGNLFVADGGYNYIFKISTNGIVTIFAGNGSQTVLYSGDGGPATNAALNAPQGLALDAFGNLFIADEGNSRIRKVDTNGIIATVAGNGETAYAGDGTPATNASLSSPTAVVADAWGDLFIADSGNNVIRTVNTNGIINTIAGKVAGGYSGDGGLATNALLSNPLGVALDASGDIFIADTENMRVRQVGTNGIINNLAGGAIGDGGPALNAEVSIPFGVAVDSFGNLFIADSDNGRIRKVGSNGIITTVAGSGTNGFSGDGGPATNAALSFPFAVAPDHQGNFFIVDYENMRIRKVDANGIITTVAGGGTNTSGDGGPATNVSLAYPRGIALDSLGDIYIAEAVSNRIRMVNPGGIITTIAGTGTSGFSGDGGPATNATLSFPFGVALDQFGNLFVADQGNGRIRKIGTTGIITTVAGAGTNGLQGDGVPATAAALFEPCSVAVDGFGDLFISVVGEYMTSNYFSCRICEVTSSGLLTTVAGNGRAGYLGDGGPPLQAQLDPVGIAVDSAGNIFVACYQSDRVREILYPASTLVFSNLYGGNIGNYDVVISNPYGSVTSSIAALNVVLPPINATVTAGQAVQLQSTGFPGSLCILQMATNLAPPINWQPISTNIVDVNGNCQFTDTNSPAASPRFYRLSN